MILIYRLSQLRDLVISNLFTKIIAINNNNLLFKGYLLMFILNIIPYFIIRLFLNLFKVKYLYKKDDIIYYSEKNEIILGPILLEAKLNDRDIKMLLDKYDNNVPINLIFQNENIDITNSNIKIKYMTMGNIKEKSFNYENIKFNLKIQLLFLI